MRGAMMTRPKAYLRIPFAIRHGTLVHVSEVVSGLQSDCLCPVCQTPLIARKGNRRVHHFAHAIEPTCNPETLLHVLGKWIIRDRIAKSITSGKPIELQWQCSECSRYHQKVLTDHVTHVVEEHPLHGIRPDLALLNASGKVTAIIEVVVSHPPEQSVRQYCTQNSIDLIEVGVHDGCSLETLRNETILNASRVSIPCPKPKCSRCGLRLQERRLYVGNVRCWKCKGLMRVAIINTEGDTMPPSHMTEQEVACAIAQGAQLHRCETGSRRYHANRCARCGQLWADEYIDNCDYITHQGPGRHAGWSCRYCAAGSYTPVHADTIAAVTNSANEGAASGADNQPNPHATSLPVFQPSQTLLKLFE